MPNPPRRLRSAGRRLWAAVHRQRRLTIHEGILLARACDLADRVARLEVLTSDEATSTSPALLTELDAARSELEAALHAVGPVAHAGRLSEASALAPTDA